MRREREVLGPGLLGVGSRGDCSGPKPKTQDPKPPLSPRRSRPVDWTDIEKTIQRWPEDGRSERRLITLRPARIFRPFTLLLWGAAFESHIFSMKRNDETVFGYMEPGFSFEADLSWEEFLKLLDPRPDGHHAVGKLPAIGLYFPVDMPSLTPSDSLVIDIEGSYEHGVLIGFMPIIPGPEAKAA